MPCLKMVSFTIILCLMGALGGCSNYAVVEGVVIMDGQPLADTTIVFTPAERSDDKAGLREATGRSDKEGHFRLQTGRNMGAMPGKYKVFVSKRLRPDDPKAPKDSKDPARSHSVESLPKRYTDKTTTPLEEEVPRGGKTNVELNLQSRE